MDWLDEKLDKLLYCVRNLSFRKAMLVYILLLAPFAAVLTYVTQAFCRYQKIPFIGEWCGYIYAFTGFIITIFVFYQKRLKKPLSILNESVDKIRQNNLNFHVSYDSRDEFGALCDSVEAMRLELERNKEELWRLIERQKELNAAFAHDLRTPLTVLRGYTDFLARYIPEGKLSEDKLRDILELMAGHLKRLEDYSFTMKGIRSIEEVPFSCRQITLASLEGRIKEVIFALNQTGGVRILYRGFAAELSAMIEADDSIIMEVLENLLSNAIRFARIRIDVWMEYDSSEKELISVVRDDGPGFSEEQLAWAVKPYHKEYSADIEEEHFGIGLHICRELCGKHGGTLNVANSIQGGAAATASFCVRLAVNI